MPEVQPESQKSEPFEEPPREEIPGISRGHVEYMESSDAEEVWCIAGMHHVVLHTIGRKSGNEHKVALPVLGRPRRTPHHRGVVLGRARSPVVVPQPERPRRQPRGEDPRAAGRVLGRRAGARRRRLRRDLDARSTPTVRGTTTTRAAPTGRSRWCAWSSSVPPE